MKEYMYNEIAPFAVLDTIGERFDLNKGDVISTYDGKMFRYGTHNFAITKERLKELFLRVYTVEDQNRYDRIYENAMIAAMQSLIEGLKDKPVSMDMHEIEVIPKNAIYFANSLVEELKEKEY